MTILSDATAPAELTTTHAPLASRALRATRALRAAACALGAGMLDLVFPWRCLHCAAEERPSSIPGLCARCTAALPWRADALVAGARTHLAEEVIALRYAPPASELIATLKYGGARAAALPLAIALERAVRGAGRASGVDLLVPVPSHWLKRLVRGFEHAGELADELARGLGVEVGHGILRRVRPTIAQGQALSPAERLRQVEGAFVARPTPALQGARVALVDDVVTSGATAETCARALLQAGAARISLFAVAGN